jgi:hypothetical protein
MAEVDAIDELEHNESDLLLGDCVLVLRLVFLQIVLCVLEDKMQLFLAGRIDYIYQAELRVCYLTILGWGFNSFRIDISRIAVEGTPSS